MKLSPETIRFFVSYVICMYHIIFLQILKEIYCEKLHKIKGRDMFGFCMVFCEVLFFFAFPAMFLPELTFTVETGIIHKGSKLPRRNKQLTGKQVRILCSAAAVYRRV